MDNTSIQSLHLVLPLLLSQLLLLVLILVIVENKKTKTFPLVPKVEALILIISVFIIYVLSISLHNK